MSTDTSRFLQVFFEEAAENLDEMERLLLQLDPNQPDGEDLNAIFRAAHSIKGGAAMFGLAEISETTHALESVLDRARREQQALGGEMVAAFLTTVDVLRENFDAYRHGGSLPAERTRAITGTLTRFAQDVPATPTAAPIETVPVDAADWGLFASADDASPAIKDDADYGFFADPGLPPAEVQERGDGHPGPQALARRVPSEASIRVGVDKIDRLMNLVGELVITHSMLAQAACESELLQERLVLGMSQLERNTRDMQEAVMSIRMLPISFVFNRFPRLVRDLSEKLGKKVELRMVGETTELDKGMIERIIDPLTHLVRNSLDHGIEAPAARLAAGKSEQGSIVLGAAHRGGRIVIEIDDDGAGLSRERILARAVERGFAVSESMSDDDVWQLIFEPGFSTAEQVTDLSGRGVGMDVVRRNVEEMGGNVHVYSISGAGTRITVSLPLTLAILDGISVAVGDEIFIVPLINIIESLQPSADQVRSIAGQGQVVQVREEFLPVLPLHELFGITPRVFEPHRGILVMVEANGEKAALFVDELIGQHQVVIKSLETHYRRVPGVSGATVMGDGTVALIVDAAVIANLARQARRQHTIQSGALA